MNATIEKDLDIQALGREMLAQQWYLNQGWKSTERSQEISSSQRPRSGSLLCDGSQATERLCASIFLFVNLDLCFWTGFNT